MKPTAAILDAIEQARREGRLIERPHVAAVPQSPATQESEADFQARFIALAQAHGWRVAHFRKARTAKGWRTPVAADGRGFPDLLLIHEQRGRIFVAELKSASGQTSDEQDEWLLAFKLAGVPSYVYRPGDWGEIRAILETPA